MNLISTADTREWGSFAASYPLSRQRIEAVWRGDGVGEVSYVPVNGVHSQVDATPSDVSLL